MRLLIAGSLMTFPAAAGAVALQDPPHEGRAARPSACVHTTPYYAYQDGPPLKPHKLTELPPAHAFSAVFRKIDGCEAPILIKYRLGGP